MDSRCILLFEILTSEVHFFFQKKIKVPGVLEKNERHGRVKGEELGNEGFLPGYNFFSDFVKKI